MRYGMTNRNEGKVALLASLLVLALPFQLNALSFKSTAEGQGKVSVRGTSTLHDWEVTGTDIRGSLSAELPGNQLPPIDDIATLSVRAEVQIPAKSLTSENRGMDRRMFSALNADKHANITFVLDSLSTITPEGSGALAAQTSNNAVTAKASGMLTIAGTTRAVSFPATVRWDGDKFSVELQMSLEMSTFGIEPPRALMGTIRTGDQVTIHAVWSPAPEK